jgi:tetratricopeptide (TPR) repeat protein
VLLVALAIGAVAAPRLWVRSTPKEHQRLDLLQAALKEFNDKNYDRATAILDRRAAEVVPTPLDWMLRTRIAESQGRLADALDLLKHIPDSDPISSQAWLKAGQIEFARHRARGAEAAYLHSLSLNPDQIQAHRELAYIYALQRRKAECDSQFRALFRKVAMDYVLAFNWCQNYCSIWNPNEAGEVLKQFVAADPTDRWSRLALATSYQLKNLFEEAEATLAPLTDSDPDARALRVEMAIDRGEITAAEELLRTGPRDHARLNFFRGSLAFNDARKAATFFRAALREEPENRDAINALGVTLRRLGDPEAGKLLELASRRDKLKRTILGSVTTIETDLKLFYKLGLLCEALDRREEASVWYQLALKRDPLDPEAHQALARIDLASAGQTKPDVPIQDHNSQ